MTAVIIFLTYNVFLFKTVFCHTGFASAFAVIHKLLLRGRYRTRLLAQMWLAVGHAMKGDSALCSG